MKTTTNKPSIYVGTYAKYNNGSLFGKWVNLTDFTSKEDFYKYCYELHKDEHDPELMFQDYEYIPENCIGESWLDEQIFDFLNLDEHEQKHVLIYQEATGYKFSQCLDNYENMIYFHSDDLQYIFFDYYPDLKQFENNPYIDIDFKRFANDFTEVKIDNEIFYACID